MFRVGSLFRNTSVLLRCSKVVELRVASLSRSPVSEVWYSRRPRERVPCPPKPPPPLPPLDPPYYLIGTGIILVLTTGFLVYAKQSPEIRDWLSVNAPWFDDLIAVVYEENDKLKNSITDGVEYLKERIDLMLKEPPEECLPHPPKPVEISNEATDTQTCDDDEEEEDEKDEEDDEPECVIPSPLTPEVTKDICKLEECVKDTAESTINAYKTLEEYCMLYNKSVRGALLQFNVERMKKLQDLYDQKVEFLEEYEAIASSTLKQFRDLAKFIDCGGVDAPKDRLAVCQDMTNDYKDLITRSQLEYKREYLRSLEYDRQRKMVVCLINQYVSEATSMSPELNYSDENPVILPRDLDLLMIHGKKYVDFLREHVDETTTYLSSKISRAYSSIPCPPGKEKEHEAKLQNAIKQAKANMDKEFSERQTQLTKDIEEERKARLLHRAFKFEEHLKERLELKRQSAEKKADKMVKDKLAEEKKILQSQLDAMKVQLITVDQKLAVRMKADQEKKRARMLHVASSSLLAATKKGDPRVNVEKELQILRSASTDDTLVSAVLNAIPGEVRDKGLVPESVIRNNYHSMEDIALKVAMVEGEGGPLPLYAFSWIQSKFLFMKMHNIPQAEIDNPPTEPFQNLDTFDLLQRARYFMEAGNLANALRYVNALEGASRGAAEAWYQSANALLQTRLAAEAIIAHAAAITLQYI